ncbi:MAG: CHASE domain-containing protein [Myxococcota bacterium]
MARLRSRREWLPWVVLVLGLATTTAGVTTLQRAFHDRDRHRFEVLMVEAESALETRLQVYIAVLRGAAGLYHAVEEVDAGQFHRYVTRLRIDSYYPGIQGIGFTRRLTPDEVASFVARQREQRPSFRVWPEGVRDEYHTIEFLEPEDARNLAAVGYDMFTHPVRREAMESARDHARPQLSGKVTLVQEIEGRKQAGFLIYVPVYRGGGIPATVEERRAQLMGFSYAPFRAEDFVRGSFSGGRSPLPFEVYDGPSADPAALLSEPLAPGWKTTFEATRQVQIAQHTWTIRFRAPAGFSTTPRSVPASGFVGTVASVLLFFLTHRQTRARAQAERALQARRMAEERERAERVRTEEAVKLRDRLLAIVTHDLRNPLGAVTLGISLLRRRGALAPPDARILERMGNSVQRMTEMVSQLMDYARLQQGVPLPLARRHVDVCDPLENVVEELRLAHPGREIQFEAPCPITVDADPERLGQALSNLVANALKYSTGTVSVRVGASADVVTLEVHNPGPPIPKEAQACLFEPFRRGTGPQESGSGLGLGLYIVREIARAHGGSVTVQSPDRDGTTFVVTLPRRPPWERPP